MVPRSMMAVAALAALAVSGCCSHLPLVGRPPPETINLTQVGVTDDKGHSLIISFKDGQPATAQATKDGKDNPVEEYTLQQSYLCFDKTLEKGTEKVTERVCAHIRSLPNGTWIGTGTNSCVCGYYSNVYKCTGYPTCP